MRVVEHRKEFITIDDTETYKRCRVQLHTKGVVLRDEIEGALINTKSQQVCHKDEFLVAEIDAKVGGFGMVPGELEGAIVSSHYFLFTVNSSKLLPEFLGYYVRTPYFSDQVKSQGSTNYAAIRPGHVLDYVIPLPPQEEQRRIVAKIKHLAAKIDQAHDLKDQSLLAVKAMVSAKTTEIFNDLRGMMVVPLRGLGENGENPIQTGPFGAQLKKHEFTEQGVPVLNVGNVWPEGIRFDWLDHVTEDKAAQLSRYKLATDDLLFARSGATLGKVCVLPERCDGWLMTGHLFRVRFDQERCLPHFAFAALRGAQSVRQQVFGQVRGATRPGFNTTLLGNVEIPLPSIREQRRIVTCLDSLQAKVNRLKALQQKTATELDALLPSILDKAFKGDL